MDEHMGEAEFIKFCEHIKVEDNSILVFRLRTGVSFEHAKSVLDAVSEIINCKLKKNAATLIVGPDVENVSMIPEEEMNRIGWFRKEK